MVAWINWRRGGDPDQFTLHGSLIISSVWLGKPRLLNQQKSGSKKVYSKRIVPNIGQILEATRSTSYAAAMSLLITVVDNAALLTALLAVWFWFRASERQVRRVSYREALDAAAYNCVVTALNRAQLLNSRAAIATEISALLVALRLFLGLLLR